MDVRLSAEQQALRDSVVQVMGRLGAQAVGQLDDAERVAKLDAAVGAAGWRELRTAADGGGPWASAVEVAIVAEDLARGVADVAFLTWTPPAEYGPKIALVREGAREAGRDPDEVGIAASFWAYAGDRGDEARERLRRCVLQYAMVPTHRPSFRGSFAGLDAADRFHVNASALSTFSILQLLVYAGMQIPVGLLVDRLGTKKVLTLGVVLFTAGQLGFAFSPSYGTALASRALLGCGDALTFISVLAVGGLVAGTASTTRSATTLGGIAVDEQFTVFGAYGAITFSALSGLLLLLLLPERPAAGTPTAPTPVGARA